MAKRTKTLGVALVTLGAFDAAMGFNSAFSASLHRQLQQHQQSHQHQHQHQHHQPQHRHQWVSAPRTVLEAKPYILGLAENQEESDARGEAPGRGAFGRAFSGLFAPGTQVSAAAALGMAYFFVLKSQTAFDVRWVPTQCSTLI